MFEKFPQQTKKEVEVERPKAVKRDVNLIHLVNFVSTFFPKIIYHCNMLNHYRKVNKEVGANRNCNCLYIDACQTQASIFALGPRTTFSSL